MRYYDDSGLNKLKDKKVRSIEWNEEGIRFNLEKDSLYFEAYGDCCSNSYIESLDNPEIFKDATFLSVEKESGEEKETEDHIVLRWTFYKFKTSKGLCTLSFRNESNGFYDGYLELVEEPTYE